MIVCPNCNHPNPDSAVQCEACYTPLPATTSCPNCGAIVQADASFCGQCGANLKGAIAPAAGVGFPPAVSPPVISEVPELIPPEPLVALEPLPSEFSLPEPAAQKVAPPISPDSPAVQEAAANASVVPLIPEAHTHLQQQSARLLHVQTDTLIELPTNLTVIHIGKPNDRIPPDIDVSGFPDSEIVSRVHADIRAEADAYYVEDIGSSNGTYINNIPLPMGNRHRLRAGDRIALGKGDKVTFLFQLA